MAECSAKSRVLLSVGHSVIAQRPWSLESPEEAPASSGPIWKGKGCVSSWMVWSGFQCWHGHLPDVWAGQLCVLSVGVICKVLRTNCTEFNAWHLFALSKWHFSFLWWIYSFWVSIFIYCVYIEPRAEHNSLQDGASEHLVPNVQSCPWSHTEATSLPPGQPCANGREKITSFSLPNSSPPHAFGVSKNASYWK